MKSLRNRRKDNEGRTISDEELERQKDWKRKRTKNKRQMKNSRNEWWTTTTSTTKDRFKRCKGNDSKNVVVQYLYQVTNS